MSEIEVVEEKGSSYLGKEYDISSITNPELLKAIDLVEQAFKFEKEDPKKADHLFERSSIAFLQAIRSKHASLCENQNGWGMMMMIFVVKREPCNF